MQTVTDADGDSDTAAINLGQGVFQIEDDGPDAVVANAVAAPMVLDETRPVGTETDGDSSPAGLGTLTASFAGNFAAVTDYGSDNAGSVGYSLVLTGPNVASGLYALDSADKSAGDGDGIGQGASIVLNQSGNTITGSAGGTNYFTITVNPGTGEITFTQLNNIWHGNTGNDDDTSTLNLSAADLLKLVQTVTDADGDSDTAAINLGQGVFQIEDDGPSVSADTVNISALNPDSTSTYVQDFIDWSFGSDGPNAAPSLESIIGNASIKTSSFDSVVIELKDADSNVVGELTVNADGTDSLKLFHREPELVRDTLLTTDVTASGPSLVKTINSSISGLVITVTASDGDNVPNEPSVDEVNPSTQGWAVKDNQVDPNESIRFKFSQAVEEFSFAATGFTGGISLVPLIVTVYYDAAMTISEQFVIAGATEGTKIEVADLPGFGTTVGSTVYDDIWGVTVEHDGDKGGFRLNNVEVAAYSTTPPPDLDYSFTLKVVDGDSDYTSSVFNLHLDGDSYGTVNGTANHDYLYGNSGIDVIHGNGGNDVLHGNGGNDIMYGDDGHDIMHGGAGNDAMDGGAGDDVLHGGAGTDAMTGGTGSDSFLYDSTDLDHGHDQILDFQYGAGGDTLDLTALFDGLNKTATELDAGDYLTLTKIGDVVDILVDHDGNTGTTADQVSIEVHLSPSPAPDDVITTLLNNNIKTDLP